MRMLFDMWTEWMRERGSWRMITRRNPEGVEEAYLERFYLLQIRNWSLFLHRFWQSDIVDLHDHPWRWGRVIVSGGYREHMLDGGARWCGAGIRSFARRDAEVLHRVQLSSLNADRPVWTLFWHGRRTRKWGFLRDGVWTAATESGNQNMKKTTGWLFPRKGIPQRTDIG